MLADIGDRADPAGCAAEISADLFELHALDELMDAGVLDVRSDEFV
ncbi:hypothetical protein [Nocardia salmonicida]